MELYLRNVDACGDGLGAVLCQMQDEQEQIISCVSKGLSKSEKKTTLPIS